MALSVVANNVPNVYSLSLTVPIFGPVFQALPRLFITLIGTAVYIVLSIAIFATLVIEEHVIFRRSWRNYELDSVSKRAALPPEIAASVAYGCGIMGAVFGVAQLLYLGSRSLGTSAFWLGRLEIPRLGVTLDLSSLWRSLASHIRR